MLARLVILGFLPALFLLLGPTALRVERALAQNGVDAQSGVDEPPAVDRPTPAERHTRKPRPRPKRAAAPVKVKPAVSADGGQPSMPQSAQAASPAPAGGAPAAQPPAQPPTPQAAQPPAPQPAPPQPPAPQAPAPAAAGPTVPEFQPVLHARGAKLTTCMDTVVAESAATIDSAHTAMSFWATTAPNDSLFQSIVGLSYPNKAGPNAAAILLAAPVGAGKCQGQTVQIYPTAQSCTAIQANLIKEGRTIATLQALPVVEIKNGTRDILMPSAGGGCVVIAVGLR